MRTHWLKKASIVATTGSTLLQGCSITNTTSSNNNSGTTDHQQFKS